MTSLLGEKVKVCPPLLVRDFGPHMDPFYLYAYSYERLQVAQHRWASRNLSSVIISFFLLNILNPADFSAARDEMACNELNEGSIDPSGGKTRRSDVPEDGSVEEPTLGLAFFSDRVTLLCTNQVLRLRWFRQHLRLWWVTLRWVPLLRHHLRWVTLRWIPLLRHHLWWVTLRWIPLLRLCLRLWRRRILLGWA